MGQEKRIGICHICGKEGELTFDHVPSKKAFNYRKVRRIKGIDATLSKPAKIPKEEISQRGVGYYSLCPKCNNDTGSWYGTEFVKWCYQGMEVLLRSRGNPTLLYPYYFYPLRVIKQIITMFLSSTRHEFALANPILTYFVLNREVKYLPSEYRLFIYYHRGEGIFRSTGVVARLNINTDQGIVMNEISFPPFGYLLTFDSEPPDNRLFEITHFSHYSYNERKEMWLRLTVLPTYLPYPGDYRTKERIFG